MTAAPFDFDASPGDRRPIIRRDGRDVEMVELAWGLRPLNPEHPAVTVVRSEGRDFPTYRCLVPASEFRYRRKGKRFSFSLADDNWFYFAGIWRPAAGGWPEAYAILTIEANADVSPYHDRQMAVLKRDQRMAWLDLTSSEADLLRPLPAGSFKAQIAAPASYRARSPQLVSVKIA